MGKIIKTSIVKKSLQYSGLKNINNLQYKIYTLILYEIVQQVKQVKQ